MGKRVVDTKCLSFFRKTFMRNIFRRCLPFKFAQKRMYDFIQSGSYGVRFLARTGVFRPTSVKRFNMKLIFAERLL
jgi:hypothetical protein